MMYKSIFSTVAVVAVAVAVAFCVGCGNSGGKAADGNVSATFLDSRDGKKYRTVKIGSQTWMAENLNFSTDGSKCYGEDGLLEKIDSITIKMVLSDEIIQDNCAKYGRLYDWNTAKDVCPAGWHLPSAAEWDTLVNYAGKGGFGEGWKLNMSSREWDTLVNYVDGKKCYGAGTKLKASTGWNIDPRGIAAGTDDYGFSALPGGIYIEGRSGEMVIGEAGNWWSATESTNSKYNPEYMDYAESRKMIDTYMFVDEGEYPKTGRLSVRCVAN